MKSTKQTTYKSTPVHFTVDLEQRILDAIGTAEPTRIGGLPPNGRVPCRRQVYTVPEVAEAMIRKLAELGIRAEEDRCEICGLLHIKELR